MLSQPVAIYINWASYDELSDNVELTEALALQQLDEMIRLRARGVRLDYYLMDAFWYAPDGAYRLWRKPHWPEGPDRWLARCIEHGIKPGLWVTTNTLCKLDPHPAWRDSLNASNSACCLFSGGYLAHFLESLHLWYERGVRLFKFDFTDLGAATPELARTMLPSQIRAMNIAALSAGLKQFRLKHPEVVFLGYNGFDEPSTPGLQSGTSLPFRKLIDPAWLEAFDAMYCGDPRPADVPAMNFWRSKDVYSDHMVRFYEQAGYPLAGIDNSGFMVGVTGTCYHRGTAAWQGMLLLSLARAGWANTYYGNLDLIDDEKAAWFARAQQLFFPLQARGRTSTFGGTPGLAEPYGFAAADNQGAVFTVVNPSQNVASLAIPLDRAPAGGTSPAQSRLLFADAGFKPTIQTTAHGTQVTLGPEQMAVIGIGAYASESLDLGTQLDSPIPAASQPLAAMFNHDGAGAITAEIVPPADGLLRILFRQTDAAGFAKRTSGGSPPKGVGLGKLLTITVTQDGKAVPVAINYDKAIWSGLSWAAGEIKLTGLRAGGPVRIRCATTDAGAASLTGSLHHVRYE
ncbi:MAG: hypothetical protein NTW19_09455 [Planctomycetota bacterium]|nr:hypothetical protein [Planctomycetota bacterium]